MRALNVILAHFLVVAAASSPAQTWVPNKPVRLIIPQVAGGGADSIGRLIGQGLSEKIGQPIIADNKPGTNGGIGVESLMHSPSDGYNIMLVFTSVMAINPAVYTKLSYDPLKDLRVLGSICEVPLVMIASSGIEANSLKEFIAFVKSKPGLVFGASSGNGTFSHLLIELLNAKAGLSLTHVPFKGEAPAVQHVMSNQDLMIYIGTPAPILGPVSVGRLKALGVTTSLRMSQLPNVPSLAEQGLPDVNESFWYGLATSSSTPAAIAEALDQYVLAAAKSPGLIQSLEKVGCNSQPMNSTEFSERIKVDYAKYGAIARSVGMKVD
jgi:tripartite-type tricarboxylate transporter receptor subunit TctC